MNEFLEAMKEKTQHIFTDSAVSTEPAQKQMNNYEVKQLPKQDIPQGSVIIRKIHTITTLTIYPNGQIYVKNTQSWLDKMGQIQKKKKKKVSKKVTITKIQQAETY